MAKNLSPEAAAAAAEKKKLREEKQQLKRQQREQAREAKKRVKEINKRQEALEEDEEGGGLLTLGATLLVVALWLAVLAAVVKLDIGGIGSKVLAPLIGDVPVLNAILPQDNTTETTDPEAYGGYRSLKQAVEQIKALELELAKVSSDATGNTQELESLRQEVARLREFEEKQVEFQRIRSEFYEEVVYAENGPGAEEYRKYYEAIEPSNAEYLYKQVVTSLEASKEAQEFATAYSAMKPARAAAIFEAMTDNLDLAAQILSTMSADKRGEVLAAMDAEVAAKLTRLLASSY